VDTGVRLYLDLMKKVLTNVIYRDPPLAWFDGGEQYDISLRMRGSDWPSVAHTMVGMARLSNIEDCLTAVLADEVPGDLIETGVWRGGVCIFMRAFLRAHNVTDRTVWVADSFAGMPATDESSHELDRELSLHEANNVLAVSRAQVQENFDRYGLLDDRVRFLEGWFSDTLPGAPIDKLALLRLDGDLYSSTLDGLDNLYPKLSPGGFVIIDDYAIPACRAAVHEYRERHTITEPIEEIDSYSAFWRRKL
jgi:hypothetical protein